LSVGREPNLPPLPFQFADFTVWQQNWLESDEANAALAFWHEHIRREMPAVDMPTDHPRSAQRSAPGNIESLLLSPDLNAKLKAYCRHNDATMHQVLLAAFEGLISRYTDQTEFLLGSTIANRTQPGMEHVVGRFANPQVILADVQGNPTYRELLKRVADWSAKSYAHQDLPFSRLMEAFQFDQSGAASQFLQVYFVYQKAFMQPQRAGALEIIPRPSVSGGVNFDLLVSVVERAEGSRLQIEYNTVLFEKQRIRRLLDTYAGILEALMETDTLRVSEFPLLGAAERAALKVAGLSPSSVSSGSHSILSWLDQWASSNADDAAIVAGNRRLSWHALHTRSLQMARGLGKLGVQAGQTVALRMEPTLDAAAAAIATLRIGAVVLPIPRTTSEAEWNLVLLDLQPALALGDQALTGKFSALTGFERVSEAGGDAATATAADFPSLSPSQPAWLNVKADASGHYRVTAVSHEATLRAMLGAAGALDMRRGDSVLAWPAHGSAQAWTDLMLPLIAGALLVHANGASAQQLQTLIDSEQVGFAFATTAEFIAFAASGWQGDRRLHLVCRGAATMRASLKHLTSYPGKIDVLYSSPFTAGPFAVAPFRLLASGDFDCQLLPVAGQQLMVLDRSGALAPFGVEGELAIRQNSHTGAGIRTGYLGRFSPQHGFAMTGLASHSVRLRGSRLKLGDLENCLYQNPAIAAAEATLLRGPENAPVLAVYVAGRGTEQPSAEAIGNMLKSRLPEQLASAVVIPVDAIPRHIDGSVNLPALARPSMARSPRAVAAAEFVPPRDELEVKLVKIWEEVLGVRGIGIRNSFFSLGGYSLMIVRLFARMNKVLGTSLPITTIFNAPTIEQLAAILQGKRQYSSLVPVQPQGSKPPLFMIHSYLVYDGLRTVLGENRPFYGLRELERDEEMTLESRAASYLREIRSVQPNGSYLIGGWCAAGPLAIETARQLTEAGGRVLDVVLFDSWRPGYAAELEKMQAADSRMAFRSVLNRKYRFHRMKLEPLTKMGKIRYLSHTVKSKLRSSRDRLYLRHWALAERLFHLFGAPLPHFMHNISLKTLSSVQGYKGKPYSGHVTLIRATDAPYIPGADPACGWNAVAQGGVDVRFAPGTHETMFLEPNLSALGEILSSCFENVQAPL
jgi:thioesterase domain-containing protein/acyl-coenzyme A synthetase/AMP-(fatty) acid ligase